MAIIPLDTSVIFDHLNGRYGRTAYLDQLVEQGHILACCPVNITEVYAGLRPGRGGPDRGFHRSSGMFAGDPGDSRQVGLLRRDWRAKGQTLSYTVTAVASGLCPLLVS